MQESVSVFRQSPETRTETRRENGLLRMPHPTSSCAKVIRSPPFTGRGKIDEILVECGENKLFIRGLFTYRAVTQPSRNVPVIRGVLSDILKTSGVKPGSYRYKGMANVFDSLPTEYLFTTKADAITDLMDLVLEAEQLARHHVETYRYWR